MYQINYTGGALAAQVFSTEAELNAEMKAITDYRAKWDEIRKAFAETGLRFRAGFGAFCPYRQYVRISALRPEDEPSIAENGIYIDFCVDMKAQRVEVFRSGHIYLTKEDQRASYLCMCGMRAVVEAAGGKWFRKQGYKSTADLLGRIVKFWAVAADALDKTTEGYPYKQMRVNIYAK